MMYLIGDTHWGHANILRFCNRPFRTIEEHDQTIINNINSMVQENDTLFHLGDCAFGDYKKYINQINCKNLIYLRGNHSHRKSLTYLKSCFKEVHDIKTIIYNKVPIILCHYCMFVWPQKHFGSLHCFAHSHGKLQNNPPGSIDIGVDTPISNFKPVSLDRILEHFKDYREQFFRNRKNIDNQV